MIDVVGELIELLIGSYDPVMQTVEFELANGTIHSYQTTAEGVASWNIEYIVAFGFMCWLYYLCVYPIKAAFRLVVGIFHKNK